MICDAPSTSVGAALRWPQVPATQCGGQMENSGSFSVWASTVETTGMPCAAAKRLRCAMAGTMRSEWGT
jgi:hypothetical protein